MEFQLQRVTVEYNGIPALSSVSFDYSGKGAMLLTGATGAGKTTLLRLLFGDLLPTSGEVLIDGVSTRSMSSADLRVLRRNLGIVQQTCRLVSDYTVFENVLMPMAIQKQSKAEAQRACMELLADLNISYVRHKLPRQLSGGEQHLVALARAMAVNPAVIVADEPTGTLDEQTSTEVAKALTTAMDNGVGLILSTHSESFRKQFPNAMMIHLTEGVAEVAA